MRQRGEEGEGRLRIRERKRREERKREMIGRGKTERRWGRPLCCTKYV